MFRTCIWSLFFFCSVSSLYGQITNGSIQGDFINSQNEVIPQVFVELRDERSGTIRQAIANADGRFFMDGIQPGGPYTLMGRFLGFVDFELKDIYIELGRTKKVACLMQVDNVQLETVEIVGGKGRSSGANVDAQTIRNLPTLNRKIQDVTRLTPFNNGNSFAGTNYRFNSINIDGAATNDIVGFQEPGSGAGGALAAGTPGALAGTQPISLDVIDQVQVEVSPFDVRQGNFNGAVINAVTKSGSNHFTAAVYSLGRNHLFTGRSVDGTHSKLEHFYNGTGGLTIGGALKKNRLFFFGNYETTRALTPVLNEAGSKNALISESEAQAFSDTLQSRYGYNPGSFDRMNNGMESQKVFTRLDYVQGKSRITLRNNLVLGWSDYLVRTATDFKYGSQGYRHTSLANSSVLEWNYYSENDWTNRLMVGYNRVEEDRTFDGDVFPHVQIDYESAGTIYFGTYREASIYGTSIGSWNIQDHWVKQLDGHKITVGTSNEIHRLEYRFLTAWNGRWEYSSLDDFYNRRPNRIRGVYNLENNEFEYNRKTPSADIGFGLFAGFVQDEWVLGNSFTLTGGVRLDYQALFDVVPVNPMVSSTPAFAKYTNSYGNVLQVNPRMKLEFSKGEWNARLGAGLFTGRIPFVWYAYSHYISGRNYANIDYRPEGEQELERDVGALRDLQSGLFEINLIDNDFQLPRIVRTELSGERTMGEGWKLSAGVLFTDYLRSIVFKNINLKDSTAQYAGPDGRSYYLGSGEEKRVNKQFTSVFLLSNSSQGQGVNAHLSVEKTWQMVRINTNYSYGWSKDLFNGVRNSMAANFNWNQAVNSNAPDLSYSNFDLRHRIIGMVEVPKTWRNKSQTRLTFILQSQSGSPFSFVYNGDVNRDNSSKNDLIYVPEEWEELEFVAQKDPNGEVVHSAEQQQLAFQSYIGQDPYLSKRRGRYAERNGARTPWNHRADLSLTHTFSYAEMKFEVGLDMINFTNFIYDKWGRQYFVSNETNGGYQLMNFEGVSDEGKPQFSFQTPESKPYQYDPLLSRWQGQLKVRLLF